MVVGAPFKSLFFGYSRIRDIFGQLEDGGEEKQHMKLLVDCMDGLFREMGPKMKDLQSKGMIDAVNIWALFPKGAIVYSRHGGHDRALEVVKFQDWRLECRSLAFDGSIFGWESVEITLKEFTGTRNINELEAYPLRFHPEQKALEESLAKRGAKALEYQDISLLDYDGQAHGRRQALGCDFVAGKVLLATLEYYSGIIFMTTNLLEGVDPAIISRLDIHLEYPCLDFATRLQLWRNLLLMPIPQPLLFEDIRDDVTVTPASIPSPAPNPTLDDIRLAEADFRDLASWRVNGRDIKHAVKNATKWCYIKKEPITSRHCRRG
ncbi:hypothetical protein PG991_012028 [Apiospora marii]|uniref:DUF7025 domain-containing protein n=1 Tax=Apiospora marii TaxID=335849 RepID=A0ABR1RFT0_9PEZI